MSELACRIPVWLTGLAVAAAGLVLGTRGPPAFACDEQAVVASGGGLQLAEAAAVSAVQVRNPGSVRVPAGGSATFPITVVNTGGRLSGSVNLEVRTSDQSTIPAMTVELADNSGDVKTWKALASEGTPGALWFTADGLSFQSGESGPEFRLGVRPKALGSRLRITAHVRDTAGRQVGATTFDVTVIDATVRVRGTFPAELRRGAAYREFDVEIHNPSTRTYHNVHASLGMTGLSAVPTPREAGDLSAPDIRLERRSGGTWHRLTVLPGCDPAPHAALAAPFDLEAGASRTLHLRIRLVDSPATKPHPASYSLYAGPAGNVDAEGSLSGEFLIRPRQLSLTDSPGPTPTRSTASTPPTTPPAADQPASTTPPTAAPAILPNTGPAVWPLAGGIALLLSGIGALVAARRRHLARR
jgi:LPXTG-motif cell wall-anchored protein